MHRIGKYIQETLGITVRTSPWRGNTKLPGFLTSKYRFAVMNLQGKQLLLMLDQAPKQEPPSVIRKHMQQVQMKWSDAVVYARDQVTSYNRKRLIKQRVSFIVPGNQMFLPELGMDLREYFRAPSSAQRKFRPATQSVLIHALLQSKSHEFTAAKLAPILGYTAMTLSRAFDELESAELAEAHSVGRERILRFRTACKETWKRAQPWLIDPVRARNFVAPGEGKIIGLLAGQSALARYSMLTDPRNQVIAVDQKVWKVFSSEFANRASIDPDVDTTEVEVWKYAPREFRIRGAVEPLSLSVSLRGIVDERVKQSVDHMTEEWPW